MVVPYKPYPLDPRHTHGKAVHTNQCKGNKAFYIVSVCSLSVDIVQYKIIFLCPVSHLYLTSFESYFM